MDANVAAAPPPGFSEATKRGEKIFKREMCVGCHAGGNNELVPSKPIKGQNFAAEFAKDEKLQATIRAGFPGSGMPSFGTDRISDTEMKDLILYIRSFTPMGQ